MSAITAVLTRNSGTPDENSGSPETLLWIEKLLEVKPEKSFNIWDELYKSVREGSIYPISVDDAVEVVRVSTMVKEGTGFNKVKNLEVNNE